MTSALISSDVDFHPVGQGLFSSGSLYNSRISGQGFHWVYDCGTSSSKSFLRHAINTYTRHRSSAGISPLVLDLLVLSHFDKDHINGVVELLSKFSVNLILLPYLPLSRRLFIAFTEGLDSQNNLIDFFLNPAAFLTRGESGLVKRVVYVPAGVPDEAPGDEETFADVSGRNNTWEPDLPLGNPHTEQAQDEDLETDGTGPWPPATSFLKLGGRIRIGGIWEFLPYNDESLAPKLTPTFLSAVAGHKKNLGLAATHLQRQQALADLKRIYDQQFGKTSKRRNQISLFLYGGPIRINQTFPDTVMSTATTGAMLSPVTLSFTKPSAKGGFLYTGDGLLDTSVRLNALTRMLGPDRMKQIGVCQVMHHGAESSWHQGLASVINPTYSIFSSDPGNKQFKHPSPPVLRDFWNHGPLQADNGSGVWIHWQFK